MSTFTSLEPELTVPTTPVAQLASDLTSVEEDWQNYRPLSMLAVCSFVVSLVSLVAFADLLMVGVSILAAVFALFVFLQNRRSESIIRGQGLSLTALFIALTITVLAVAAHAIEYATELPEGYQRLSYEKLQPDERDRVAWQKKLMELDGEKVLLKGYAFPGNQKQGIRLFMLCRDKGDCCFGGQPKITDRVLIEIADNNGIDYTDRLQKFTGVFRFRPTRISVDTGNGGEVWYILEQAEKR